MHYHEKLINFVENARCFLENSPGIILIKDLNSTCFGISQSLCRLQSMKVKDCIGKKDALLPWGDFAETLKHHDHAAITQKAVSLIEPLHLDKSTVIPIHIVKSAIVDKTGETIGILAQSNFSTTSNNSLSFLSILNQKDKKILDYLLSCQIKDYDSQLKLTQRETECLFLLIRGKSAKEIARFLEISPRTVEEYIEHIKVKMNVSTRHQIITKAIEMKMLEIIPKNNLLMSLYKNPNKWRTFFEQ